ncbi:MAG: Gfo/Idh/MocA family protein [Sphaerochaetaceae bacterium]|jgi:scyllo-inositol 2-dehydrogenase (NAD+)
MSKLRCGVIGLGRLGYRHAANLAGVVSNAELVAVSDVSKESLNRFKEAYPEVKQYDDYKDILKSDEVDAVIIASSTSTHGQILKETILSGKPSFIEKPLSLDWQEAVEINELVEKEKVFVQLGFMRRFDPAYSEAKDYIDSNSIGNVVSMLGISRDPSCPPIEFAKKSGGIVMDLSVHDIDLARWFINSEVKEVYANGAVVRYPELGEIGDLDHINLILTFENGKMAYLEGSRNSRYGYDVRTEVVCSEGGVKIGTIEKFGIEKLSSNGTTIGSIEGFLERFEVAYLKELEQFVNDVLANKAPSVGVYDGLKAMEIALAANESLKINKPVSIR